MRKSCLNLRKWKLGADMSDYEYKFKSATQVVESIRALLDGREEDAERFLEQYVDQMEAGNTKGWSREKCREVCLGNIGYCAGYLDFDAIRRVNRLLGATHIAFGTGG